MCFLDEGSKAWLSPAVIHCLTGSIRGALLWVLIESVKRMHMWLLWGNHTHCWGRLLETIQEEVNNGSGKLSIFCPFFCSLFFLLSLLIRFRFSEKIEIQAHKGWGPYSHVCIEREKYRKGGFWGIWKLDKNFFLFFLSISFFPRLREQSAPEILAAWYSKSIADVEQQFRTEIVSRHVDVRSLVDPWEIWPKEPFLGIRNSRA